MSEKKQCPYCGWIDTVDYFDEQRIEKYGCICNNVGYVCPNCYRDIDYKFNKIKKKRKSALRPHLS